MAIAGGKPDFPCLVPALTIHADLLKKERKNKIVMFHCASFQCIKLKLRYFYLFDVFVDFCFLSFCQAANLLILFEWGYFTLLPL